MPRTAQKGEKTDNRNQGNGTGSDDDSEAASDEDSSTDDSNKGSDTSPGSSSESSSSSSESENDRGSNEISKTGNVKSLKANPNNLIEEAAKRAQIYLLRSDLEVSDSSSNENERRRNAQAIPENNLNGSPPVISIPENTNGSDTNSNGIVPTKHVLYDQLGVKPKTLRYFIATTDEEDCLKSFKPVSYEAVMRILDENERINNERLHDLQQSDSQNSHSAEVVPPSHFGAQTISTRANEINPVNVQSMDLGMSTRPSSSNTNCVNVMPNISNNNSSAIGSPVPILPIEGCNVVGNSSNNEILNIDFILKSYNHPKGLNHQLQLKKIIEVICTHLGALKPIFWPGMFQKLKPKGCRFSDLNELYWGVKYERNPEFQKWREHHSKDRDTPISNTRMYGRTSEMIGRYFLNENLRSVTAALCLKLNEVVPESVANRDMRLLLGPEVIKETDAILNGENKAIWGQKIVLPEEMREYFPRANFENSHSQNVDLDEEDIPMANNDTSESEEVNQDDFLKSILAKIEIEKNNILQNKAEMKATFAVLETRNEESLQKLEEYKNQVLLFQKNSAALDLADTVFGGSELGRRRSLLFLKNAVSHTQQEDEDSTVNNLMGPIPVASTSGLQDKTSRHHRNRKKGPNDSTSANKGTSDHQKKKKKKKRSKRKREQHNYSSGDKKRSRLDQTNLNNQSAREEPRVSLATRTNRTFSEFTVEEQMWKKTQNCFGGIIG